MMMYLYILFGGLVTLFAVCVAELIFAPRKRWYLISYNADAAGKSVIGHMPIQISGKFKISTCDDIANYIGKKLDEEGIEHGTVVILNVIKLEESVF